MVSASALTVYAILYLADMKTRYKKLIIILWLCVHSIGLSVIQDIHWTVLYCICRLCISIVCCYWNSYYPVGHKKRATLLWTITSAFLNGFQQLMHQWKKE